MQILSDAAYRLAHDRTDRLRQLLEAVAQAAAQAGFSDGEYTILNVPLLRAELRELDGAQATYLQRKAGVDASS